MAGFVFEESYFIEFLIFSIELRGSATLQLELLTQLIQVS